MGLMDKNMDTIKSLSDLVEMDDFQKYKNFIKNFILNDMPLWKIIYSPLKNPLIIEDPENPYVIFQNEDVENDNHGVVLFKQKNNEILNYGTVCVLVDFETTSFGNSDLLDNLYIIFRIIIKSNDIDELENGLSRLYIIADLINRHLDHAEIGSIGYVKKQSMNPIPANEENSAITIIYKCRNLSNRLLEEANK
jgi:hypothetical protein